MYTPRKSEREIEKKIKEQAQQIKEKMKTLKNIFASTFVFAQFELCLIV